jgi:hypothetical protein
LVTPGHSDPASTIEQKGQRMLKSGNRLLSFPALLSLVFSAVLLILGARAWASGQPWKVKPYQQWNNDDLQRVFYNSPWSHSLLVERTWISYRETKELPTGPLGGQARTKPDQVPQTTYAARGPQVGFFVYWASSRVMRAALARQDVLASKRNEADAYKDVEQPLPDYLIAIAGDDMAPFQNSDESFFQAQAFLQPKKTKQKISPARVTYEKGPDGKTITIAVFYFPKKTAAGDPLISPDEKNVQFSCPIGGSTLQFNFEPQKMIDAKGSDL